ncbi:low temperature requirement protein A [Micromonospora sp. CA-263727]|uniref:low temperature requirement protein A n=1 Tax=Micromonospora sp. CA-263727 TaxID=3239967 RepID=UPI003D8EF333
MLRIESGPQRATSLELFLDLVFVFALTRVSQRLVTDLATEQRTLLLDASQTLLLFLALWLIWITNAYLTSRLNPEARVVVFVMVLTMVGSMVMAVALPQGFGERALVFAGAYVAVQVGRVLALLAAARGEPDPANPAALPRVLMWSGLTAVLWLAGGVVDLPPARGVLWSTALILDYAGLTLGWPVPGLGRSRHLGRSIAGEHLAERYQQFLLIALGETILTIGFTLSGEPGFTRDRTAGFALAMITTVQFWRIYFFRAGHVLPLAITSAREPVRLGVAASFTHLTMVAGILVTGVGYELYIDHPLGHATPAWIFTILGGPALFLLGRAGFEFQVFSRVSWSWLSGLLALGVFVPAMLNMPPLAAGGASAVVLLGVVVLAERPSRSRAPEAPAPPI